MDTAFISLLTWIGVFCCISQSAVFSGMNLALFSISRLRLEVEADLGNRDAAIILNMRKDSNFLLTTILWGNVGINVLLTLISNSVMAGLSAFLFSTIVITFLGEIIPQAGLVAVGVEDDRALAVHLLQAVGVQLGLLLADCGVDRRLFRLDHGQRLAVVAP